jgi:hypothetical protein
MCFRDFKDIISLLPRYKAQTFTIVFGAAFLACLEVGGDLHHLRSYHYPFGQ